MLCVCVSVCASYGTDELSNREIQTQAVFTNSEISLKHVDVYGFDFDYTLLQYTREVHKLIYAMARKRLVEKLSVSVFHVLALMSLNHSIMVHLVYIKLGGVPDKVVRILC